MFTSTIPAQSLYVVASVVIGAIFGTDISLSGSITISALLRLLALSFKVVGVLHGGPRPGISAKALVLEIISLSCRLASSTTCEGYLPSDFTGDFTYQAIDMLSLLVALWLLRRVLILTRRKQTGDLEFDIIQAVLLSATVAALCHAHENLVPFFDALWLMGYVSGTLALVPEFLCFANTSSAGMSIYNKHSSLVSFASWAAHIPLMAFYVLEYPLFDFSKGETFGWPLVAVNMGSVALYFGLWAGYEASGPLHSYIHWTGVARSRRLEFPKSLRTSSFVSSAVLCLCGMLFMPLTIRTGTQAQEHRYAAILLKLSVVFANVAFYTKDSRWKPSNAAFIFTGRLTRACTQLMQGFNFAALRVAGSTSSGEDPVVKRKRKCSTFKGNAESHATDPTQRKFNVLAHEAIPQGLCAASVAAEVTERRARAGNCKGPTILSQSANMASEMAFSRSLASFTNVRSGPDVECIDEKFTSEAATKSNFNDAKAIRVDWVGEATPSTNRPSESDVGSIDEESASEACMLGDVACCDEDIGVRPESTSIGPVEIRFKDGGDSEIGDTADPARITVEDVTSFATAPPKVGIHIGSTDETLTEIAYFGEVEIDVRNWDKEADTVLIKKERGGEESWTCGDEESWTSAPTSDSSDEGTTTSQHTVESYSENARTSAPASFGCEEFTTQSPSGWEFEEGARRVDETSIQPQIFLDAAPHGVQWFTDGERTFEPVKSPSGQLFYTDGVLVFDLVCIPIEAGQRLHAVAEDGCATFKTEGAPRVGIQEVQDGAGEDPEADMF
jgi:hypothetical protein